VIKFIYNSSSDFSHNWVLRLDMIDALWIIDIVKSC